jgi:uncharacterized protein (DUF4415 family)
MRKCAHHFLTLHLDRRKNATNVRRHGIAFDDAKLIFDGPTVEHEDDRFEYGETRGVAADPDIRPTDESFWKDARVVMPKRKETLTMRLDADLLAWFRRERGYQTRINAILRAYMNPHIHPSKAPRGQ